MKTIIKNNDHETRIIWRLFILVGLFLIFAFLLRFIPIRIYSSSLISEGMTSTAAINQAQQLFLEDETWTSILGALQGLAWYPMLFVLIYFIDRKKFTWKSIGLSFKMENLVLIPIGVVFSLLLFFGYFLVGNFFGEPSISWNIREIKSLTLIFIFVNFLTNGFGEESAFRAYIQTLLLKKHGIWLGILLSSCAFVLLHLFIYEMQLITIISGILLASLFGILYIWTGSILLVGTMHTIFNLAPNLFDQWPSDIGLLIIHGLTLGITSMIFIQSKKYKQLVSLGNHKVIDSV